MTTSRLGVLVLVGLVGVVGLMGCTESAVGPRTDARDAAAPGDGPRLDVGTTTDAGRTDVRSEVSGDLPARLRLVVTPAVMMLTVAEGAETTLAVALNRAPESAVTVTVTSSDGTAVSAMPASLSFDATNFATPQTVTVGGVDDADTSDDTATVALSGPGVEALDVGVEVADDDIQEIRVNPEMLTVDEGMTGRFNVRLGAAPDGNVTVTVASARTGKVTVAPATLTFTAANYATNQAVTVTTLQDADFADDVVDVTLMSAPLADVTIPVTVADDDQQGLAVTPGMVTVTEGSATAQTFSVRLNLMPAAAVTVNLASLNPAAATVTPATMTFTPANYLTNQTASVRAPDDVNTANETTTVNVSSAGLTTRPVAVTVTDDDTQAIVVQPTDVTVTEGGTATYTVRLAFRPAAAVTVTNRTGDALIATVAPASLMFTPANYATPRTVTVTGVQDSNLVDGVVQLAVASPGLTPVPVDVTVDDDDVQGITTDVATLELREGGTAGLLRVRLNFPPAANTTVNLASSNPKVMVSPASLTFTPANFATNQTVMVTTVGDADGANDTANLTLSATGVPNAVVTVTVIDDDVQRHVVSSTSVTVLEQDAAGTTFGVHLGVAPLANVTVTVASPSPSVVSVTPATLTFTPANYATDQTVTVRGLSDPNLTDDLVNVTVSSPAAATTTVMVHVEEDDLQDLVVTPATAVQPAPGALVVTEDAAAPATLGVALQFQPAGTKGVRVRSNNPSVLINGQAFADLLFTTSNYATVQSVTVTTPSDNNMDQPADTTLTVGLCETACSSAVFSAVKTVNVDARDDDTQRIIVSAMTVPLSEDPAAGASFTVRLAFEPLAGGTETVTVTSSDTGAATAAPATLVAFTAANYATPQTVTLTGVDDADLTNEVVTVTLHSNSATTAEDATVRVNVTDDGP